MSQKSPSHETLPVWTKNAFEWREDIEAEYFEMDTALDGSKLLAPVRFSLVLTDSSLAFAAGQQRPPQADASLKTGEFAEGLWKRDAAELFIARKGSTRYFEINLSPYGAWWTRFFSGYRRNDANDVKPEGVECFSEVNSMGWRAAIAFPRPFLEKELLLGKGTRANVAFIVDGSERHHVSWAAPSSEKPDFHKAADYVPLRFLKPE